MYLYRCRSRVLRVTGGHDLFVGLEGNVVRCKPVTLGERSLLEIAQFWVLAPVVYVLWGQAPLYAELGLWRVEGSADGVVAVFGGYGR